MVTIDKLEFRQRTQEMNNQRDYSEMSSGVVLIILFPVEELSPTLYVHRITHKHTEQFAEFTRLAQWGPQRRKR